MSEISFDDVTRARARIRDIAVETPLVPSPFLTDLTGTDFLLKLEIAQPIGAFKIRGAANALLNLPAMTPGVVCSSTGNHGRGVAYAARALDMRAVVCMSELVPKTKVDGIRALGAKVRIVGKSQDEAAIEAARLVEEDGLVDISPFDDPDVIAGQGSIGLELLDQCPDLQTLLVPLSGGGLAGGIALAVKTIKPSVRIIGVTMDDGAAMYQSLRAGHPVDVVEKPSLADSLGGGIGLDNRYSFALCRDYLDDTVLVSEADIYRALQTIYYEDRLVCEGGCAVGVAAVQSGVVDDLSGPVATIITGRNIDMSLHSRIMQGLDVQLGDLFITGRTYGT